MITPGTDNKKHFVWVLVENAIKDGVKSTTRYRKSCSKKSPRSETKAFQRQRSGQKGGKATRKWKKLQAKTAEVAAVAASDQMVDRKNCIFTYSSRADASSK